MIHTATQNLTEEPHARAHHTLCEVVLILLTRVYARSLLEVCMTPLAHCVWDFVESDQKNLHETGTTHHIF